MARKRRRTKEPIEPVGETGMDISEQNEHTDFHWGRLVAGLVLLIVSVVLILILLWDSGYLARPKPDTVTEKIRTLIPERVINDYREYMVVLIILGSLSGIALVTFAFYKGVTSSYFVDWRVGALATLLPGESDTTDILKKMVAENWTFVGEKDKQQVAKRLGNIQTKYMNILWKQQSVKRMEAQLKATDNETEIQDLTTKIQNTNNEISNLKTKIKGEATKLEEIAKSAAYIAKNYNESGILGKTTPALRNSEMYKA